MKKCILGYFLFFSITSFAQNNKQTNPLIGTWKLEPGMAVSTSNDPNAAKLDVGVYKNQPITSGDTLLVLAADMTFETLPSGKKGTYKTSTQRQSGYGNSNYQIRSLLLNDIEYSCTLSGKNLGIIRKYDMNNGAGWSFIKIK